MSTVGTLSKLRNPSGCLSNWNSVWNELVATLQVTLPESLAYIIQDSTPNASDQDKLWYKTVAGFPEGIYKYQDGLWLRAHPIQASSAIRFIFTGNSAAVDALDGGNSNSVTPNDGPFWEIDSSFAARFPVGVGSFDSGASVALVGTGGAEKVSLTVAQIPPHSHATSIASCTFRQYSENGTDLGRGNDTSTFTSAQTGGGESHDNVPPYYGVHFIKRTARIYIRG